MDASLAYLTNQVAAAKRPEDLFGELGTTKAEQLEAGKRIFRQLSRAIHPDRHHGDSVAAAAYARISELWRQAQAAIAEERYGQTPVPAGVTIRTRQSVYDDVVAVAAGDLADVYRATSDGEAVILKVARHPADADLMQTEAQMLRHLYDVDQPEGRQFLPFLPEVLESFRFQETGTNRQRTATAFKAVDGLVGLEEIRRRVPAGVHPKDMAWMWRRLLLVLGYVHARGVIHGAVLPSHLLIHPEGHGLLLVDWCYSVRDPITTSTHIPAISTPYENWYPAEVLAKEPPRPGTDILMGARCMVALLGGDPLTGQLPETVPMPLRAFFRGCLLDGQRQRPQNAWVLLEEFTELIERLWGKRKFRPFILPPG